MIFDEAHNLLGALGDLFSPRITLQMLRESAEQLNQYYIRYQTRLASASHSFIIHLQTVLTSLITLLSSRPPDLAVVSVVSTDRLLRRLRLEEINLFELIRFVSSKHIVQKLNGFVDRLKKESSTEVSISHFPAVLSFVASLTSDDADTKIVVNYEESTPSIQLLLLNPENHFRDIAEQCRSVVITGGTIQPVRVTRE